MEQNEALQHTVRHHLRAGKIGFIGAGNMAQAIAAGVVSQELADPVDVYASAPSDKNLEWWKQQGMHTTHNNEEIIKSCETVILAVKPQYLDDALCKITTPLKVSGRLFISVLAGVTLEVLEEKLMNVTPSARVVRVIPNTPLLVGAGCSAFCTGKSSNDMDVSVVNGMFSRMGVCVEVKEPLMSAAGAVAGCGPAFMYLIIESLADGGVQMGLPRDVSQCLAAQTMLGAAQMVLQTGRHPGKLKDEVCSPGGTTIAGMRALENHGVRSAMMAAVEAATLRSLEMGKKK